MNLITLRISRAESYFSVECRVMPGLQFKVLSAETDKGHDCEKFILDMIENFRQGSLRMAFERKT